MFKNCSYAFHFKGMERFAENLDKVRYSQSGWGWQLLCRSSLWSWWRCFAYSLTRWCSSLLSRGSRSATDSGGDSSTRWRGWTSCPGSGVLRCITTPPRPSWSKPCRQWGSYLWHLCSGPISTVGLSSLWRSFCPTVSTGAWSSFDPLDAVKLRQDNRRTSSERNL